MSEVTPNPAPAASYPLTYNVDYPDRELDRLSVLFRLIYVIPIAIVLSMVSGGSTSYETQEGTQIIAAAGGTIIGAAAVMIIFRQKYPKWWFDFNLELLRFSNRVGAYMALLSDQYPSTDEEQYVHLELAYPDVKNDLSRWAPLYKWIIAFPHYVVLFFLYIFVFFAVVLAWFAILFTARYPRGLFNFVVGVTRWSNRVAAYVALLATDKYPPFSLE